MTMFKPRFLMTARERSRRDADYGEVLSLRESLARMNAAQREDALRETRAWARETAAHYFASVAVVWFGVVAFALVLAQALVTRSGPLLLAAILVVSMVLLHITGLEQRQSMFYGARRALQEFFVQRESRFGDE